MDTEFTVTKGTTERGVPYVELLIDVNSDEISIRRYPRNTYVAVEMLESTNGGADINGIFSVGGVVAKVSNCEFDPLAAIKAVNKQYKLFMSEDDISTAVAAWQQL